VWRTSMVHLFERNEKTFIAGQECILIVEWLVVLIVYLLYFCYQFIIMGSTSISI
jgi:hypothetical protein